ncbi:putative transmembrane protein ZNF593OS isoform X1 [Ovis canadensis]|uniref:putative transmembrane protein ZNF593OS isoform X1 n=1 Tax=Ovis canadensis TaxID=37174 RepID=UPI0037517639
MDVCVLPCDAPINRCISIILISSNTYPELAHELEDIWETSGTHHAISTPDPWLLPSATDADSRGAEGRAPESAGGDCGCSAGCPRAGRLLLCCLEDGGAAAAATGSMTKQAASHIGPWIHRGYNLRSLLRSFPGGHSLSSL